MALSQFDQHLLDFIEKLGHFIGWQDRVHDKVFPLFTFAKIPAPPPDGIVNGGIVRLTIPLSTWGTTWQGRIKILLTPYAVIGDKLQERFHMISGLKPPLTADFADDTLENFPHAKNLLLCGADTNLSLQADGEKRWVQLYQDTGAPAFPNAFCSPGGVWNVSPATNAVKELNEEIGMVVRQGNRHFLFHFSQDGQTGISLDVKKNQIARVHSRLTTRYGGAFAQIEDKDLELLEIKLIPDDDINLPRTTLSVSADSGGRRIMQSAEGVVLYKEKAHSIIYQTYMKLPDFAPIAGGPDRLDLRNLERGKTLFIVDTESELFNREVYCLTEPELKYVMRFPRAMMDNTHAGFSAGLPIEMPPAGDIWQWTKNSWQRQTIVPNASAKDENIRGGPFQLMPTPQKFGYLKPTRLPGNSF